MFEPESEPIGQRLARLRPIYITVFLAQAITMGAVITWREYAIGGHADSFDILIAIVLKMDNVAYLAIITSVLIVDFGRYLLGLLIKAPQDRAREEGLATGRAEGIAAERSRWADYNRRVLAWHQRYLDARNSGESFDEPPPRSPSEEA